MWDWNGLCEEENQNQESQKARNFFRVFFFALVHGVWCCADCRHAALIVPRTVQNVYGVRQQMGD